MQSSAIFDKQFLNLYSIRDSEQPNILLMSRGKCPFGPPQISLLDDDLAAVGRIAMLEARAKAWAIAALKGVASLSSTEWQDHQKQQFAQIMTKLIPAAGKIDSQLYEMVVQLETLRNISQDDRHKIVHATWGEFPGSGPSAYDFPRQIWLRRADIQRAIVSNEATDHLAYECVWITAKLVEEGIIPQRLNGAGPAMRLDSGLWKW